MRRLPLREAGMLIVTLLMLLLPAMVHAQSEQEKPGAPPIGQPLVREGEFAIKLEVALAMGTSEDEAEAESRLGEIGIAPRNGWIADYPVTPDIVGELRTAVGDAADSGKLSMSREEALKRLDGVIAEFGMAVTPHVNGETHEAKPTDAEKYPDPTVVNNYYYNEGPPVVTYYAPPPDYYYLYSWVPYPFWWTGFWFPGFFVLHDFHRTVIVNKRVVFVSNHFNDVRVHRVFRIDPVTRFRGRTFGGIGAPRTRDFIPTGVPRSDRQIFNGTRTRTAPGARVVVPPSTRSGRTVAPSPATRGRSMELQPSPRGGRVEGTSRGGGMRGPSSGGGRGQRR